MGYHAHKTFLTVLEVPSAKQTRPPTIYLRSKVAPLAEGMNAIGCFDPIKAIATNIFSLCQPYTAPVLGSLLAWFLLGLVASYVTIAWRSRNSRPTFGDCLRFTYFPTVVLGTIQLGLSKLISIPTYETYEARLTGQQAPPGVRRLRDVAICSWLLTVATMLTIVLIGSLVAHIQGWKDEMNEKKVRAPEATLPPLCP